MTPDDFYREQAVRAMIARHDVEEERVCPRCKRTTSGWLLARPDRCSPKDWVRCIRQPQPEWVAA